MSAILDYNSATHCFDFYRINCQIIIFIPESDISLILFTLQDQNMQNSEMISFFHYLRIAPGVFHVCYVPMYDTCNGVSVMI